MPRSVTIELTTEARLPAAGIVFSHNRFTLFAGSSGPDSTPFRPPVDTPDPYASFADVPDGAYSVQVTQLSTAGDAMNTLLGEVTVGTAPGGGDPVSYQHAVGMSFLVV